MERYPFPFHASRHSPPLSSPATNWLPENQLGGLSGSSVSFSSAGRDVALATYAFLLYFGATFFHDCPKKKQLYLQEVPERRSKIYINKYIRGNLKFPQGIPPGYMSGRNTDWSYVRQSSSQFSNNKLTPSFFTDRMPLLLPYQQCQSIEGWVIGHALNRSTNLGRSHCHGSVPVTHFTLYSSGVCDFLLHVEPATAVEIVILTVC